MKILICGFEPFGNRPINNSWEVVKQFNGKINTVILRLPVSFNRAHKEIINVLDQNDFDFVLTVGETVTTSDYVRLERVAINYRDSLKSDNDGVVACDEAIITSAPKAYFTEYPLKELYTDLTKRGLAVKISNTAGTFVCNHTYFNILHYLFEKGKSTVALFVHVPAYTEKLTLCEMTTVLEAILGHFFSNRKSSR